MKVESLAHMSKIVAPFCCSRSACILTGSYIYYASVGMRLDWHLALHIWGVHDN